MTKEEVESIMGILEQADGGCIYCAGDLTQKFAEAFPEFKDLIIEIFEKKFNRKLYKEIKE